MPPFTSRTSLGVLRFEYALASQDESLAEHLLDVARQCNRTLVRQSQAARRVTICAALAHDAGKATHEYQRAIRQQTRPDLAPAAYCGALWCWWLSRTLTRWERVAAAMAVLEHHGLLSRSPQGELRALAGEAENGELLHAQIRAMDVEGVGQFLLDAGSRLLLQVPSTVPSRQQLLDALAEDRQVITPGRADEERVNDYLDEHGELLTAMHC